MVVARAGAASKVWIAASAVAGLLVLRLALGNEGLVIDAGMALVAALSMWKARRLARRERSRRAWRFQMLFPLVWVVAPAVWLVDGPPALADAARVIAIAFAISAWWLSSHAVDTWSRVRLTIDGGLAAGSVFVVGWEPAFRDAWLTSGGGMRGAVAIAVPLSAVWAATFLTGLTLTEMRGRHRLMPSLFVAALVVIAWSDVAWVSGGTPLWAAGWALTYLGTRTYAGTSGRSEVVSTRRTLTYAPYLLMAPAALLFAVQALQGVGQVSEIWAGALMGVLLLLRQHVTLAENRRLVQRLATTERLLRHQATHDHLTGLGGRGLWWERLEAIEAKGVTEDFMVGVLFVDLDGFKRVNDGHGHATGDHVLVETARRLLGAVAPLGDDAFTVRLSGDEFAILLVREPAHQCAKIAESLLDVIKRPIDVNGVPVSVGASVGVATTSSRVLNPSALLRAADVAMYRVKRRGKGGVEVMGDETSTCHELQSSVMPTTGESGRQKPKDSWKRA